jgi:hypothetical protein
MVVAGGSIRPRHAAVIGVRDPIQMGYFPSLCSQLDKHLKARYQNFLRRRDLLENDV